MSRTLDAQVLTIGETLGKGKSGLLISDNVLIPGDGIPNLNVAYALFAKGVSERVDLYLSAGGTRTEGTTQAFVGGGGNLRLARVKKATVSLFGIASVALNRRDAAGHRVDGRREHRRRRADGEFPVRRITRWL